MNDDKGLKKEAGNIGVLANVEAMLAATYEETGPDVVIVVSSSCDGALFWQERLTGPDEIHGSGAIVKSSAIVLSVSESNWNGPAGNALGTINAFYQAGIKAEELAIISSFDGNIDEIFCGFLDFCRRKSVFMYHTAGKGTRLSPLTAAEYNSKSRIKLPGMVETKSGPRPLTVLEASIRASSVYASSRKGRLSVFWADQVILNELDVSSADKDHLELFAHPVPLDESIRSYGIIIPTKEGGCLLREKLDIVNIRKKFPEISGKVYKSIGSFSLSLEFFESLADSEREAVISRTGELNTDRDWWQALTSEIDEYKSLALSNGVPADIAEKRWEKTRGLWNSFRSRMASGLDNRGMAGFKDVGAGSLWMDFGRISCLLDNTRAITENSPAARAARRFFQADKNFIDSFEGQAKSIKNSVLIDSRIGSGKVENCVVVSSDIGEISAENSLIVGSEVRSLRSVKALCYNAVSREEDLKEGDVLVNIFDPVDGRIVMRTDVSRDGQSDWVKNEKVMGNKFSYGDLAEKINGIAEKDVERVRRDEIEKLRG